MSTLAAEVARRFGTDTGLRVARRSELVRLGCTDSELRARVAAGRWRRLGHAIVLHNGPLTREERWRVGVLNCGPRAVLGSFSAAEHAGLDGWERPEVHVLVPAGVPAPTIVEPRVILHRTVRPIASLRAGGQVQAPADAMVLAASSFTGPRPACGILAAGVQQRLLTPQDLRRALDAAPRVRHRRTLRHAVDDIAMGAQALSEIDFVTLCRRHHLPVPVQQTVRRDAGGRRRYLDAEWIRADGQRVVGEVDGALHLTPRRWSDDQLRQNEIVLAGSLVLRWPSVVIRTDEAIVADQVRRALLERS